MSLLNDALRAAEQRQNRPQNSGVYTGQPSVQPARRWRLPVVVMAVASVAVAGYVLLERDGDVSSEVVDASPVVMPEPSAPVAIDSETNIASKPEPTKVAVAEKTESVRVPLTPAPEQKLAAQVEATPAKTQAPARVEESEAKPASRSKAEFQVSEKAPAPKPEVAKQDQVAAQPAVKQVRETPEAIDLRVSRELERSLRSGDSRQAEQKLMTLTANQAAPVSREVFARAMLLQQQPDRALRWLNDTEVSAYPALRLLRARALLTTGDLTGAVNTLRHQVPPVREHMEYRVTLATLLQQAGEAEAAARHWTDLISVDDSRPAWWVGLAIALESQGELASAARAYGQAAQLPGLSPSLADYVRERLKTLQAG